MGNKYEDYNDDVTLAYDLRQRYAKLVGDHLEDVTYHRKNRDFPSYYNSLDDLYVVVAHKFKDTKKSPDKYQDLIKELIILANKYPQAWIGNNSNSQQVTEIEQQLKKIEKYLYFKMDEGNIFGSKRGDEGL